MKKKISIIDCAIHRGGAEVSIEYFIKDMQEYFDFILFVPKDNKFNINMKKETIDLNKEYFLNTKTSIFSIITFIKLFLYGYKHFFGEEIITNTFKAHIIGLGYKIRNKNIKWIIYERDVPENILIKILKYFIHKKADCIIFNSKYLKKRYINIKDSIVIYNKIKNYNSMDNKKERNIFLYVGSITYSKGFDRVIDVFNEIKIENKKLIVLGEIPEYDKKINIKEQKNIEYKGFVNPKEYYKNSGFIMFFNRKKESFSRIIAESMQFGVVPIILKNNGMDDYVRNNYNGIVFEKYNSKEIAKKIEDIFYSKEYSLLSNNAKKLIIKTEYKKLFSCLNK